MFHGFADNPKSKGTPMRLPVVGERATLNFQRELNEKVHDLGLRVVGHFRLGKVYGDWDAKSGFVDYYQNRWPEDLLGPKPHADLRELLQRDSEGNPIHLSRYNQPQLALCLSSPHARQMLKQMLKVAIDQGIDGVITTYNYQFGCACQHCEKAFDTGSPPPPVKIPGYPETEAERGAMRWSAAHFKAMYDEIFINYGRSLRPDLLVAQWNHLSNVSLTEERNFMPVTAWGKDESYFWYSGGASFVGKT